MEMYAVVGVRKGCEVTIDKEGWILPTRMENLYVFAAAMSASELEKAKQDAEVLQPLSDWSHAVIGKLKVFGVKCKDNDLYYVRTSIQRDGSTYAHGSFWWFPKTTPEGSSIVAGREYEFSNFSFCISLQPVSDRLGVFHEHGL